MKAQALLLLLILGGLVVFAFNQGFVTFDDRPVVWTPLYTTVTCDQIKLSDYSSEKISDSGEYFACPMVTSHYAPLGCEYYINADGIWSVTSQVKICDFPGTCGTDLQTILDRVVDTRTPIDVPPGSFLYINPDTITGSWKWSGQYARYGLVVRTPGGKLRSTTNCNLDSLQDVDTRLDSDNPRWASDTNGKLETNYKNEISLSLFESINVVSAVGQTISLQVIQRPDITGTNEWIYVLSPKYYSEITQTDDGQYYVLNDVQFYDEKIECTPGEPGCANNATWQGDINSITCDELLGNYHGYVPVNTEKACLYECVESTPTPDLDNCVNRDNPCESNEYFDPSIGECKPMPSVTGINRFGWERWYLWAIFGALALIIVLINLKRRGSI